MLPRHAFPCAGGLCNRPRGLFGFLKSMNLGTWRTLRPPSTIGMSLSVTHGDRDNTSSSLTPICKRIRSKADFYRNVVKLWVRESIFIVLLALQVLVFCLLSTFPSFIYAFYCLYLLLLLSFLCPCCCSLPFCVYKFSSETPPL